MELMQAKLFAASIVLAVLSTVVVALRCVARAMIRGFWVDDYFMIAAQVLFIVTCILSALGTIEGLGVKDRNLAEGYPGPKDPTRARQKAVLFQITYSFTLALVKTSIALALYRITTSKVIRGYLWFIIGLSAATSVVILGVLLSICRPAAATWDPTITARTCASNPGARINGVFIFSTISAIVTDFSCSIIPYIIIWRLQMPKKTKIMLASVLGLSFVYAMLPVQSHLEQVGLITPYSACAATLVRLKYIPRYSARSEFYWGIADPYIWTLIEIGIAIMIGSVYTLRPLAKKIGVLSSTDRSKTVSRRELTVQEAGRVATSHRVQSTLRPQPSTTGSEEYELLDPEAGTWKNGTVEHTSQVTTRHDGHGHV
ncbi:Oxysterol-binding 1 [Sphaceloma murrayae]|uniref:Oxysterol-binding 1 n=1 Tax=Sphaceloma murrayae TaxID=2082308 RepID=A0A2K1QI65_9PEZI|nr:Oxysterol-binding 1 [Sphaceloma murrayae]